MNKKGFTLIELLAVLVVLAILALISIPITIRIINQTRDNSYKRSIESYGRAVESYIGKYLINNDVNYKNIKLEDIKDEVKYNGSEVSCRKLKFKDNGDIVLTGCTVNGIDYYKYEDRHVTKQDDTYNLGNTIKVNGIDFYVIKDNSDYVTALKKDALNSSEINKYGGSGTENNHVNKYTSLHVGTSYEWNDSNHTGGMAYYTSDTCGYLIPKSFDSRVLDGCKNDYDSSDVAYTVNNWSEDKFPDNELKSINGYKARLLNKDDLLNDLGYQWGEYLPTYHVYGFLVNSNVPSWVISKNYRYWTMVEYNEFNRKEVWHNASTPTPSATYDDMSAVRPVINVYKYAID